MSVSGTGLYELMISDGREFENHLPLRLIDKLRPSWHADRPSVTQAKFSALHPCFELFADLKVGLRRREAESMSGECKSYWEACADAFPHSNNKCCLTGCSVTKKEDACKQVIFEPLGRTLLKDAVAYLTDDKRISSPKRSTEYLPSPNDAFWKVLGQKVAAYGIGIKINTGI
ncbi:MAG: hypothetical protein I8H76_07940 [Burkholderiales bacterium]|nr:hypothetical protein [Burkholderiales bacterium]MBH2017043.1 hypothetical protein [Burkholderiales bacterium]